MNTDSQSACDDLQAALLKLHASGLEGFEGLIRDAYREATGIPLRLQKSGTQHGADAVPGDSVGDIAAGIEAKRYRATTSLPLDQLKSKLFDAATRNTNPIELWILAASKEVSGDDAAELCRIGDEHGLGVLVLDWRSDGDPTAPLPLLLTLAPNAVRQHLGDIIANAVSTLVEHPEYDVQKDRFLKQLVRPDLGLSHAAKVVNDKISHTLQSRADAKAQLQNPVDLEAPARIWAPRDSHCKAIQEWKVDAAKTPVCATIGEEGVGKTWLMFDWWRRETDGDNPPLILWLSARDVASGSVADAIGTALEKWISMPKRNAAFWSRRVDLWRRTHGPGGAIPFVWLMLDGVNEGTSQENVLKILYEAVATEWIGNVGILLSDRPAHWARQFHSGKSLEVSPRVINVSQFSETELDDLLAKHDKNRDDFSPEVLRIIHWPSWFAVAAEMFDKEHDWSAHSPEQLMMRYWQHYLQERGRFSVIDDAMFRDFVARLGAKTKVELEAEKNISTLELKDLLSGYSGSSDKDILAAVDDITSGIWMRPDGTHQFIVDKAILPFAISLALLHELQSSVTDEGADSECEKFLGPIENQDIGVDILGAAVSLAFIESEFPDHAKKTLMKRWINSHNFNNRHFHLLWRIASASPEAFFAVAEDLWLQRATGHSIDELLIKCVANIANDGDRMSDVIAFMEKWAATYWPDPREGQFLGYNPTDEESAGARATTKGRLKQLRADLGDVAFAQTGLRCCENGVGASWLSHRMFAIATYLPRAIQRPVWRGWALSRTVMGNPRHYDDLAWSLRLNPLDGLAGAQALIETVDELLALQSQSIHPYMLTLLEAHGGPKAADKLSSIGGNFQTYQHTRSDDAVEFVDGVVELRNGKKRSDKDITVFLSNFARSLAVKISGEQKEQLERYARDFPVDELSRGRDRTGADIDLEQVEPALARWAPEALATLYRRLLATLSKRDDKGLMGLSLSLDGLLVLLPEEIQQQITATLVQRTQANTGSELDQIGRSFWSAAVFDATPVAQREIWEKIGAPEEVPKRLENLIRSIPIDLLRNLESELHPDRDRGRLISWLGYLSSSATTEWPVNWETLWRLFDHEDGTVRFLAFNIALRSNDKELAQRLYETEWKASSDHSIEENGWGSCLLSLAATPETFETIRKRIDPQWSDKLWRNFDYDPAFINPFRTFLSSSVEHECNAPSTRTFPEYQCSPADATRKFLEFESSTVTALADRLFDLKRVPAMGGYGWPRKEILQAFFESDPQQAAIYWRKMDEGKESIMGKSEVFDGMPFAGSDGDEVNELRDVLLKRAKNDWEIMALAVAIARHERSAWAVEWIKRTLAEPETSADIARAVTLAGLLDDSVPARELWTNELRKPPLGGWIEFTYFQAKQNIEKAWNTLHWLDQVFAAETDEQFFAFWRLFALSADYRLVSIASPRLRQKPDSMNPRHSDFIDFNWMSVVKQATNEKNTLERTLFATSVGFRQALPWAR